MKRTIKMYLHSSKESNHELIGEEGLEFADDDAASNFLYTLMEVEFEVEVDLETGDTKILTVDGKLLIQE